MTPGDIRLGEPLTITYTNYRGETADRTICPIAVFHGHTDYHPEPQWLCRATDLDRGVERVFALQDMQPVTTEPSLESLLVCGTIRADSIQAGAVTPCIITANDLAIGKQSKVDSWIETIINVAIGYLISLAVWSFVIGPLFGLKTSGSTDTAIVSLFTVTSIARQYTLRRLCNGRPIWATVKAVFA